MSNFELKQLQRLEDEIDDIGKQRKELQRKIDKYDPKWNDYDELSAWVAEMDKLAATLETKEERWLELSERAEL